MQKSERLSGSAKHVTFAMMCYEDEKYEKGEEENKQESKNPDDEEKSRSWNSQEH